METPRALPSRSRPTLVRRCSVLATLALTGVMLNRPTPAALAASGKLEAFYCNPRSIHMAKAEATPTDDSIKVFIELRDTNYPGSTYTCDYNAASDYLAGIISRPRNKRISTWSSGACRKKQRSNVDIFLP